MGRRATSWIRLAVEHSHQASNRRRVDGIGGTLGALLLLLSACGCGNRGNLDSGFYRPCSPGKATCLSERVGQICNSQGQWATFQCAELEDCADGACVPNGLGCESGTRECVTESVGQLCSRDQRWISFACPTGHACTDGDCSDECVPETHECVTSSLLRICRGDGLGWTTNECPTGTTCTDGACAGTCVAAESACASNEFLWQCLPDGSGYVERRCPASMTCSNGACAPNSSSGCTFGQSICLDESTSLECLRDGSGYRVLDCETGTACQAGKCWGAVCAAGSTSCVSTTTADFTGIQTCNDDGAGYTVTICDSAGKCVLNKDLGQYECYVPPCTSGEELCGIPNAVQEASSKLSRCETLANGKLGWVVYECDEPATCKSTSTTAAACHTECSPGDKRCSSDGLSVETCGSDGTWKATGCGKTNGKQDACVAVPSTKEVLCGDADCRSLASTLTSYSTRGRCQLDLIAQCNEKGRLTAAAACDEGRCTIESDGFGICKDPSRCAHDDGWRECIASGDAYRTCMSGHWEFTLCDEGELCSNAGDGLATCGDDCIPGKQRCVDADYQTCSESGTWGLAQHCSVGECNLLTNRCEAACVPGQLRCVGEVAVASDGSSLGSRNVQRCSSAGAWTNAEVCSSGTLCRRSGLGEHVGCVQCVGPSVSGGNEEGAVDSRCNTAGTGYQVCAAANTWPTASTTCTGTERCVKQRDGTVVGTCSNYGCATATTRSRRCIGYETVTTAVAVDDCCAGECDSAAGTCLHRRSHYDPTCPETASCFTGRYDASGASINETCCAGYCKSGQGCLRIKAAACTDVTSCSVTKLDHSNVCCGTCLTTGLCATGSDAKHPVGEYFACGSSTNICWGLGACTLQSSGSTSGAMFANCVE